MATTPRAFSTFEDFESYDWQELIDSADERDCTTYSRLFHTRAQQLAEAGDDRGRAVFRLLSDCASPWLDAGSKDEPLRPMAEWESSRTPIPADIPDAEVELIPQLASITRDAELRARLADIAWLRRRDHCMAQLAIESYIDSAKRLDAAGSWIDAKDRAERALRLAAQLGKAGREKFDAAVQYVEGVLARADVAGERGFQPLQLMELLIDLRTGDVDRWSVLAETLAEQAEVESDWRRAGGYWETKAAWERRRGDDRARLAAQVRAAETEVNHARDYLEGKPPNYLVAAVHLEKTVEGMRQASEPRRAEEIHRELLGVQGLAMSQMQRIGHEFDITSFVTEASDAVRGQSLDAALLALVIMQDPPSVVSLREQTDQSGKELVFSSLFQTKRVDRQGRTVGRRPSRLSDEPAEVAAAIEADMFELAGRYHEGYAAMFIEPAREQIVLEHHVRIDDLGLIVANNPLVPPGRGQLVLRGLYAGLIGDFVVACHLLIPQIEHAIRHVLNLQGVVTTGLSSGGIQEEQDLSRLLQREETIATWGEDFAFDLRGLLVERFGANLRNRLAHGLVDEHEFDSWQGSYLWWISLRFYMLPILMRIGDNEHVSASRAEPA